MIELPQPTAVLDAAVRLQGIVNQTPIHTSRTLDAQSGQHIFLKCENFQRVGAFKFRGAYNAVSQLSEAQKAAGVVTHSSGNHAQGLALAAQLLGVKATIVMPEDSPQIKKAATAGYGATIVTCPAIEREVVCRELIAEHGYTLIHPYDNPHIIAGAGTAARELLQAVGPLDLLLAPIGGGGLLSGTALAAAAVQPNCQVIGVEPAIANDAQQSWQTGQIVRLTAVPPTLADGLRTRYVGEHNLPILRQHVADILTVTEAEIVAALQFLWTRLKLVVEPSSAVALAPLLTGQIRQKGQRVGVILSGGNVDVAGLGALFTN
ncbi:MAG: pyridoxal-phosphate dependent enzyme [Anaerolineae bacterium]|nr:pyridoxal-phosphate dependent enzyme [Anaerolineae bacterium]